MEQFPSRKDDRSGSRTALILGGAVVVIAVALVAGSFLLTREKTGKLSSDGPVFARRPGAAPAVGPSERPAKAEGMAFIRHDQQSDQYPEGAGPASAQRKTTRISPEVRAREKAFLERHDGTLHRYQERLSEITRRYHERHAVVREVDDAFGKLDRYMAVKRRYEQDRDVYQWARDSMALPEVRAAIFRYMKRPEAWSVAVDMTLEALRDPPPPVIYNEAVRFMSSDPVMMETVGEVAVKFGENSDKMVMATMGKDLRPLQKIVSDVSR